MFNMSRFFNGKYIFHKNYWTSLYHYSKLARDGQKRCRMSFLLIHERCQIILFDRLIELPIPIRITKNNSKPYIISIRIDFKNYGILSDELFTRNNSVALLLSLARYLIDSDLFYKLQSGDTIVIVIERSEDYYQQAVISLRDNFDRYSSCLRDDNLLKDLLKASKVEPLSLRGASTYRWLFPPENEIKIGES